MVVNDVAKSCLSHISYKVNYTVGFNLIITRLDDLEVR